MIGLGVSYKNGADGTMGNLKELFPNRVFDTPVSEATTTGAAIGSALTGMRPIIHHGRVEFALFAADQIITQASKWNYMFGGDYKVPIVFRIAIGRQWGNGPQHTQALYSLFGNVIGLKVVIPSSPKMAKGLLISAMLDDNPVIFLEPRWLYQIKEDVDESYFSIPLNESRIVKFGTDITIVSYGDGLIDSLKASVLLEEFGISAEVIDLVSINPIDYNQILQSVKKTGRLITVDTTNYSFNVGSEVIAKVCMSNLDYLKSNPISLSTPDVPCPTATSLTSIYYPTKITIANRILEEFGRELIEQMMSFEELHLPPTEVVST